MPEEPLDYVDGGSKATGKAELPYNTLRQMQLEREDQSIQEACDKYGKVCIVVVVIFKFWPKRGSTGGCFRRPARVWDAFD